MYNVGDQYTITFLNNTVGTIKDVEQIYLKKEDSDILYQELILSVEYTDDENNKKMQEILIRNDALKN